MLVGIALHTGKCYQIGRRIGLGLVKGAGSENTTQPTSLGDGPRVEVIAEEVGAVLAVRQKDHGPAVGKPAGIGGVVDTIDNRSVFR